jgi:cyclophilin family peptidyl-prolyl cis-trans isomerase
MFLMVIVANRIGEQQKTKASYFTMTTLRLRQPLVRCLALGLLVVSSSSWTNSAENRRHPSSWTRTSKSNAHPVPSNEAAVSLAVPSSRRSVLQHWIAVPAITSIVLSGFPVKASADATTAEAAVTDRVYVEFKGLPNSDGPRKIVIGLFGKDAPDSVSKIKQLVSPAGLPTPCRPKGERTLQKEQLEANKVYSRCKEIEGQGVPLQYSNVWRIIKNERIDVGDVRGKFIAREFPNWQDTSTLQHDMAGVVSVRRGNDGGFGFTIYPGDGKDAGYLNEEHIVVGRVIEGMDVVKELNEVPVIASSKVNYMGLSGAPTKNSPTRACRYGGPMYCNENKPLIKLSIVNAGIM